MRAENFKINDYLSRISYADAVEPSINSVKAVMQSHIKEIPFENIDVQLGQEISLVPEDIYSKLVDAKRGGYCYEHNGLFAQFLNALGLAYQVVACRPMFYPEYRPRTHLALVVSIDEKRWLCDLGFGALGINEPIDLDSLSVELVQGAERFKLVEDEGDYFVLHAKSDADWQPQYAFNLSHFDWIDFIPANYFNATHPQSFFVQNLVVLIKTATGRHTLLGQKLKSFENGVVEEKHIPIEQLPEILLNIFKVPVSTSEKLIARMTDANA